MQENNKKNPGQNLGLFVFECVMSLLYLGVSYILLFTKLLENIIPNRTFRLILGVVLGLYGIFRVYRVSGKFVGHS